MYVSNSDTGCKTFVRGAWKKTLIYLIAKEGRYDEKSPGENGVCKQTET